MALVRTMVEAPFRVNFLGDTHFSDRGLASGADLGLVTLLNFQPHDVQPRFSLVVKKPNLVR